MRAQAPRAAVRQWHHLTCAGCTCFSAGPPSWLGTAPQLLPIIIAEMRILLAHSHDGHPLLQVIKRQGLHCCVFVQTLFLLCSRATGRFP